MSAGYWYVRRGEEQLGPFSETEFEQLHGELRSGDWLRYSSWSQWQPIERWREETELSQIMQNPSFRIPAEALVDLLNEHLLDVGISVNERQKYQYVIVMEEFARSIANRLGSKPIDLDVIQPEFESATHFVEEAAWSFERHDSYGVDDRDELTRLKQMWRHRDLGRAFREGYLSNEACSIDRDGVASVAQAYLRQNLRSPTFEVLLVDALLGSETYEFGEELKKHPSQYEKKFSFDILARSMSEFKAYDDAKGAFEKLGWIWLKLALVRMAIRISVLIILPIVIALWANWKGWEGLSTLAGAFAAIAVAVLCVRAIWRFLCRLFRKPEKSGLEKAMELYHRMVIAYDELEMGIATSPRRIREVVSKLSDEGAAWNPSVFAILDGAIMRSPGNWS